MGLLKCIVNQTEQEPLVIYRAPTKVVVDAASAQMKTMGVKVHPMGLREAEVEMHSDHFSHVLESFSPPAR